jgi:PAS domain S-box-containing protein
MVAELSKLAAFTIFPGTALALGIVYSLREIYRIGEKRIAIILLILGFMLFHQTTELVHFIETSGFRDPVAGEIPETFANLIAAVSVYYVLLFLCMERELKQDLQTSRAEIESVKDRLELIFENVNDGVLLVDLEDDSIIEANRSAHELLRYEPGELQGLSPYDIHPHEPELFEELTTMLRADGGIVSEQLSCRRGDGSVMPAAVSVSRTELDGTDVMLVTIRDNTDREQYRSQVDLFTRVLRHNFRNDINIVIGYLNIIAERVDDSAIEEYVTNSLEKCDGLINISEQTRQLNDILDTEYGKVDTLTDLVPLVQRVTEEYEHEHPHAQIETELPREAIVAASENVVWAIENLVENAIVHADGDPEVRIEISNETIEEDGLKSEWTTMTVADRGPGIPESEVVVLEDDSNRTQIQHGSGLGLWIAQQIAQIFDGHLDIDRSPDSGFSTEISLRLQPGTNGYTVGSDGAGR